MIIFIDGSYKTRQCFTDSETVKFTSALLVEEKPIIKEHEIKRGKLKHYGNLAEMTSLKMAIDYFLENGIGELNIFTDSTTLIAWVSSARKGKKKKFTTEHHLKIYQFLIKVLSEEKIKVVWVPRDENKIGVILEEGGYE